MKNYLLIFTTTFPDKYVAQWQYGISLNHETKTAKFRSAADKKLTEIDIEEIESIEVITEEEAKGYLEKQTHTAG